MKTLFVIAASCFALATAQGASYCNAGGADPLVCQSRDGQTVVWVHPRFYYTLGLTENGFCDGAYLKIDGVELNGPADGTEPAQDRIALVNTQAVTSSYGMTVQVPHSREKARVSTAASFELTDAGISLLGRSGANNGDLLVFQGDKRAKLFLSDDDQPVRTISLRCK